MQKKSEKSKKIQKSAKILDFFRVPPPLFLLHPLPRIKKKTAPKLIKTKTNEC